MPIDTSHGYTAAKTGIATNPKCCWTNNTISATHCATKLPTGPITINANGAVINITNNGAIKTLIISGTYL